MGASSASDSVFQKDTGSSTVGVRHLQVFLQFLCVAISYLMRVNLSVGVVLMTDTSSELDVPTFNWTMAEKSGAQSAFFFGYFLMNLVAAVLVTRWDSKWLLFLGVLVSSLLTLATPALVICSGYYMLLAVRALLGLMQGLMMSCLMTQLSNWIPPVERARCGAFVLCGSHMGTVVSFAASGWLGSTLGWPAVYYFPGAAGLVWALVWLLVGAESPAASRMVSLQEKVLIERELQASSSHPQRGTSIPWRKMFRNKACWALVLVSVTDNWGYATLVTEIPTYFESVVHLPITANGLISAVPYACLWLVSMPSSYVADLLIKKERTSITFSRKMCNTIGHCGAAAALIALTYTQDQTAVIVLFTTCVTLTGFTFIGYNINHLDILPDHAGTLMGITNGVSNITSFLAPLFAGFVVSEPDNKFQWTVVFWVSAAVYFIGNVIFVAFGSGEIQKDLKSDGQSTSSNSVIL